MKNNDTFLRIIYVKKRYSTAQKEAVYTLVTYLLQKERYYKKYLIKTYINEKVLVYICVVPLQVSSLSGASEISWHVKIKQV